MYKKIFGYVRAAAMCLAGVVALTSVVHFYGDELSQSAAVLMGVQLLDESEDAVETMGFESEFLQCTTLPEQQEQIAQNVSDTQTVTSDAVAVNLSALSGKYANYRGTSVINNTDYDVTGLLYEDYELPAVNKEDPYILVYHTHTSESYSGGGTVVDVGNEMAAEFERLGYKTVHLTEAFDDEQFSGSYSRSAVGVKAALEKYPTVKLVFDVHRDAITDSSGVEYRPVTSVNGENAAQVMLVCGTDAKGLEHPNWRENFKFALDVSRNMGTLYGALSRPVNLRGDRFNTHFTKHSFIMEVGSAANTLDEAKHAALLTARSVIATVEK